MKQEAVGLYRRIAGEADGTGLAFASRPGSWFGGVA